MTSRLCVSPRAAGMIVFRFMDARSTESIDLVAYNFTSLSALHDHWSKVPAASAVMTTFMADLYTAGNNLADDRAVLAETIEAITGWSIGDLIRQGRQAITENPVRTTGAYSGEATLRNTVKAGEVNSR